MRHTLSQSVNCIIHLQTEKHQYWEFQIAAIFDNLAIIQCHLLLISLHKNTLQSKQWHELVNDNRKTRKGYSHFHVRFKGLLYILVKSFRPVSTRTSWGFRCSRPLTVAVIETQNNDLIGKRFYSNWPVNNSRIWKVPSPFIWNLEQ